MRAGAFERAWEVSDIVLHRRAAQDCRSLPRHLRWLWDGTPLAGRRVLVRSYHGLGDTLQFIRLVPLLARSARSVAVRVQPELLPLLRCRAWPAALLPLDGDDPEHDVAVELMELPHALRLTLEDVPRRVPYIVPPLAAAPRAPSEDRLRVGIAWAAGAWRPQRSLPLRALAPIAALPVALSALQQGPARTELDRETARWFTAAIGPAASILETAAHLQALDLVITVDTMVAHLAGAIGVPVWTLLHHDPDWRWMTGRSDSPWYPTMRLFRQRRPGAWGEVVAEVATALAPLAEERRSPSLRSEEQGRSRENGDAAWQSTKRRRRR